MKPRFAKISLPGMALIAVLAASLAVSACGRKGDPARPDSKIEEKADG